MSNEATIIRRDRYNVGQPVIYAFNGLVVAATALLWVQAYTSGPTAAGASDGPVAAAVVPGSSAAAPGSPAGR